MRYTLMLPEKRIEPAATTCRRRRVYVGQDHIHFKHLASWESCGRLKAWSYFSVRACLLPWNIRINKADLEKKND